MCNVKEQEWAVCGDPQKLLDFVRPRTSQRKLQLFLCAQLRRSCPPISGFRRRLAELLERVADGVLSGDALTAMIEQRLEAQRYFIAIGNFGGAAYNRDQADLLNFARLPDDPARGWYAGDDDLPVLRDLFRPFPVLESSRLSSDDGTVRLLALAAYEERILPQGTLDPARLAVLGDA